MIAARPEPFAESAQAEAADPAISAWVTASAGTGKTKVLTDRVLRLLLGGTPPQRILCLTFTRAAAAEMTARLTDELGHWVVADEATLGHRLEALTGAPPDEPARARARRLFAAVLDAPGGLALMTIHAFCQSLLARFPLEAGVAPHFEVLEERAAAELLALSQRSVLTRAGRPGGRALARALGAILAYTDERRFAELMAALRKDHGRIAAALEAHGSPARLAAAIRHRLGVADGPKSAHAAVSQAVRKADARALRRAAGALGQGSATSRERGARIARWLDAAPADRVAGFDAYLGAFFTTAGSPRARLIDRSVDPAAEAALVGEQARLGEALDRRRALLVAELTGALVRLADAMLAEYAARKARIGRLDYADLVRHAVRLLETPGVAPWVLYKLDGGLDHILVDEAQDTSPEQWAVIAALAEEFFAGEGAREVPRTLFVVGDEKQSIFSFQGADVASLERMRDHFAAKAGAARAGWGEIPLALSFRSTDAVLEAVDAVFARDEARAGVAFAGHDIRHEAHRAGHAGLVELWPLAVKAEETRRTDWAPPVARRETDAPSARLARRIARTVRGWIDGGERLEARDRPIHPGDVLVLVRRRTAFVGELMRALKAERIAVAGADRLVLTEHLAVMDLMALGHFLLLPEDDLTLATLLKSPLIGLDEDALFALAHGREGSLWRALTQRRDENASFAAAHEWLAARLAEADFAPPYALFASVLAAGGRRRLAARLGADVHDPLDEFLDLALAFERQETPSLEGFLHWLDIGEVTIKRDMERGGDAVRIMTVHGAKGLQAPIVILPDTTGLPPNTIEGLAWDGDIPLRPLRKSLRDAKTEAVVQATLTRRMEEYRRLLYVAMTRAEDRLVVCGWTGRSEAAAGSWYRLVEASLADIAEPGESREEPGWVGRHLRLARRQRRAPEPDGADAEATVAPATPPAFAHTPPAPEPAPPRPLAPSAAGPEEPAALSPIGGGADRFHRGRLIHRLLEHLPGLPAGEREGAGRAFLARPGHRLAAEAREAILAEVMAVLNDPAFAAVFTPEGRAEVPLVARLGETVIAGQVDRLLVTDEAVLVVDYKTNRAPPADPAGVPRAYLAQMAAYRAVLARIFPDRPVRCAILWTDGPTLMPLADDALAAWHRHRVGRLDGPGTLT